MDITSYKRFIAPALIALVSCIIGFAVGRATVPSTSQVAPKNAKPLTSEAVAQIELAKAAAESPVQTAIENGIARSFSGTIEAVTADKVTIRVLRTSELVEVQIDGKTKITLTTSLSAEEVEAAQEAYRVERDAYRTADPRPTIPPRPPLLTKTTEVKSNELVAGMRASVSVSATGVAESISASAR